MAILGHNRVTYNIINRPLTHLIIPQHISQIVLSLEGSQTKVLMDIQDNSLNSHISTELGREVFWTTTLQNYVNMRVRVFHSAQKGALFRVFRRVLKDAELHVVITVKSKDKKYCWNIYFSIYSASIKKSVVPLF